MEIQSKLGCVPTQGRLKKRSEVAQETPPTSMTITTIPFKRIFWRPNNYRRGLDVLDLRVYKRKIPDSPSAMRATLGIFPMEIVKGAHNNLIFLKMDHNITIQLGRVKIVGIWSQAKIGGVKEIYSLEANNVDELDARLDFKKGLIRDKIDKVMFQVARALGCVDPVKSPVWVRHEDFIKGEEFIDSIPEEVIIHDSVFKKVYGRGVEFFGGKSKEPNVGIKNYIKNRALESFIPQVTGEMAELRGVMGELAEQIRLHLEVQRETKNNLKKMGVGLDRFNRLLSQKRLREFG